MTALLDLDRHVIQYMVNEHLIPGNAFNIPKKLWGQALFPHVYVKEATFEVYFGPQDCPTGSIAPPELPPGFSWVTECADVPSPYPVRRVPHTVTHRASRRRGARALHIVGGYLGPPFGVP